MPINPLIRITAELKGNGTWECIRERKNGGEKLSGARSIKEVIQFIEAHDHEWEILLNVEEQPDRTDV